MHGKYGVLQIKLPTVVSAFRVNECGLVVRACDQSLKTLWFYESILSVVPQMACLNSKVIIYCATSFITYSLSLSLTHTHTYTNLV